MTILCTWCGGDMYQYFDDDGECWKCDDCGEEIGTMKKEASK